ncbi:MAG: AtpZ/AtpI family protein [Deltaproteobacteria bacterium]|jgi:ATP synthase protein I|nr:AtpZ/AtpI family protein [Deltaproteobacteria bacterium]
MLASTMGLSVVIAILLGLFAGVYLDKWLKTAPWLTIAGLVVGTAAGFRNIFILSARIDKAQKEDADGR